MKSVGYNLLSSVLHSEKGAEEFLKLDLTEKLFIGEEKETFQFIHQHVRKHGVTPTPKTLYKEIGELLDSVDEPPTFYLDKVEARYIQTKVKQALLNADEQLVAKKPLEAFSGLLSELQDLTLHTKRHEIVNLAEHGYDLVFNDYKQKWLKGDEFGIKTGWETFDLMSNGVVGGDVVVIAGRPASGKTYMLLNMARHAWHKQGKKVMLVSMEMKPLPLIHRLTAIHTSVPSTYFKKGDLVTKTKEKVFSTLQDLHDKPPFWIIDGNLTATVDDIAILAQQLKPDVIYVDGAYMLRDTGFSKSKWEKISNTAEGLKQKVASDMDIPVFASYQFNRDQTKVKKQEEDTGIEHLAGADAIGQIASIVLGLLEEDTPETLDKKHVRILKGREGETGGFDINWLFDKYPYMNFDEYTPPEQPTELSYA